MISGREDAHLDMWDTAKMRIASWLMAIVLGSLTSTGAVNVYPFSGLSAVAAMIVALLLGAFVAACVVTSTEQLVGTRQRRVPHR